ncbi:aminotransferase [Insolitispirillum peregrinum]|uniref:Aspartate/methionine/tyrosine aminotransferase n=1 Tax=Insolitispirillum peregrinum TaxID=80876 RepID=A0A1N7IJ22_9PROT|nr:aminotransferase [Insolitispirillum peregrinum]SIS37048.1 Aspartate/methionine/tyrosine aminotransferase [Insolitispirillum peregrinum]
MKPANSVLSSYGTTIFEVMSGLAQQYGAVNLGQGTPEGLEPQDIIDCAARHMTSGPHQYPSMFGVPELRQAIAAHDQAYYGLDLDWRSEVMITSGATEALADCLFGLIEPGDEVVLFEPLYDSYLPIIRRAGGIPKLVRLAPPEWAIPDQELAAAFSDRTKLVVINTPANPCAKVFTRAELTRIAELATAHDAIVLCDEVYEHLVFDGLEHVPVMTLPGMRERCVRIGSFGKVFSITNWKVGYIVASPLLMQAIAKTHQFITFTTPAATQQAVAWGLQNRDDYVRGLAAQLSVRRDQLSAGLAGLGFRPLVAQGTYFLSADFSALSTLPDSEFCQYLVREVGVATVPISAFYVDRPGLEVPRSTIRFCFAKTPQAIDTALERLAKLRV